MTLKLWSLVVFHDFEFTSIERHQKDRGIVNVSFYANFSRPNCF